MDKNRQNEKEIAVYQLCKGRVKMVNVHTFVKSLKVAWIRQLVMGHNQQWFKLFGNHYSNTLVRYTLKVGDEWYTTKERITYISNEFWLEVFES